MWAVEKRKSTTFMFITGNEKKKNEQLILSLCQ